MEYWGVRTWLEKVSHWRNSFEVCLYPGTFLATMRGSSSTGLYTFTMMFMFCHRPKSNRASQPWTKSPETMAPSLSFFLQVDFNWIFCQNDENRRDIPLDITEFPSLLCCLPGHMTSSDQGSVSGMYFISITSNERQWTSSIPLSLIITNNNQMNWTWIHEVPGSKELQPTLIRPCVSKK